MASLNDVLNRPDAQRVACALLSSLAHEPGGREAILEWVRRPAWSQKVLVGGALPQQALKEGGRARKALESLLADEPAAAHSLALEVAHRIVDSTAKPPSSDADELSVEESVRDAAKDDPISGLGVLFALEEDPGEDLLKEIAQLVVARLDEGGAEQCAEGAADEPAAAAKPAASISQSECKALERQVRDLTRKLEDKSAQEKRLSRKNGELREANKDLEKRLATAEQQAQVLLGELERVKRGSSQAAKSQDGRLGQLEADNRRLSERIDSLTLALQGWEDDNSAAVDYVDGLERQVSNLESQLAASRAESEQRLSIGDIFRGAEPERALAELEGFSETLGSLKAFVTQAVEAQQELRRQDEIARAAEEAEAENAKRQAELLRQQEEAWQTHQRDRVRRELERRRAALFSGGDVDELVVDGHNLILRCRPGEPEPKAREWLTRMTCAMAQAVGVDASIVFDGPKGQRSSSESVCSGVTTYYHSDDEGGADAKIAELIREFNPDSRVLVASSDFRHVVTDAIRARQDEGLNVSSVEADALYGYLLALEEMLASTA